MRKTQKRIKCAAWLLDTSEYSEKIIVFCEKTQQRAVKIWNLWKSIFYVKNHLNLSPFFRLRTVIICRFWNTLSGNSEFCSRWLQLIFFKMPRMMVCKKSCRQSAKWKSRNVQKNFKFFFPTGCPFHVILEKKFFYPCF